MTSRRPGGGEIPLPSPTALLLWFLRVENRSWKTIQRTGAAPSLSERGVRSFTVQDAVS
jgi:hypothetical protein